MHMLRIFLATSPALGLDLVLPSSRICLSKNHVGDHMTSVTANSSNICFCILWERRKGGIGRDAGSIIKIPFYLSILTDD